MNREQYIELRKGNKYDEILYNYFQENNGEQVPFGLFMLQFHKWLAILQQHNMRQGNLINAEELKHKILEFVLDELDKKFTLIFIIKEEEITIKETRIINII